MSLNNTSNTSSNQYPLTVRKTPPKSLDTNLSGMGTEDNGNLATIIADDEKKRKEELERAGDLADAIKSGDYFNNLMATANNQRIIGERYEEAIEKGDIETLEMLLKETKEEYQGGLSDEIFSSKPMREYMLNCEGVLYNYFQLDGFRSNELDKLLEDGLRKKGLNTEEICNFLCSNKPKFFLGEYDDNSRSIKERKDILNSLLNEIVDTIKQSIERENFKASIAKTWIEGEFGVEVLEMNLKNTSRSIGGGEDGEFYNFNGEVTVRTKDGEIKTLEFISGLGKPTIIVDWNGVVHEQKIKIKI